MYETINIEKNKSSRFSVHFYKDAFQWENFKENCNFKKDKFAIICNQELKNEDWSTFHDVLSNEEDILKISSKSKTEEICEFIANKQEEYTFIILCDSFVMSYLYQNIPVNESKFSFISIPVTPYALFSDITVRPLMNETGELIRKELFPMAVYVDVSIMTKASPLAFQDAIASAFKLAISYKASMFEWMISNMYEITDCEETAIYELLERGFLVRKERIEKDTAKERALSVYGEDFYNLFKEANYEISEADATALSLVCQTYLSWKKELISMEEFYEIRDMLVFFGLSITETFATVEELNDIMDKMPLKTSMSEECVYIRKLGKLIVDKAPEKEMVYDALKQIYFDEEAND